MKTVLISTALIIIGRASTKNDSKENDSKVALMPPFISSEQEIFAMASNRFHDTITKRDDALRSKKSALPRASSSTSARHQDLLLWPGIDCRPLQLSIPAREFCRLRKSPHFLPVGGWVYR
jgi:hypothetical protein